MVVTIDNFRNHAMPLSPQQQDTLRHAIEGYDFPTVYFDFQKQVEGTAPTIVQLETILRGQLESNDVDTVRHGLANVLYWGYATSGYRDARVSKFVTSATAPRIVEFMALLEREHLPKLREIKSIGFAQFSGISFVSKILMFLNPVTHCTLDLQILKLVAVEGPHGLHGVVPSMGIPINANNEQCYDRWRAECSSVSARYYNGDFRAADVERGYFKLVRDNNLALAKTIYANA